MIEIAHDCDLRDCSREVALDGIAHRIELYEDFFDAMRFREGLRERTMQAHS
jgi:hypothetical protein